ncbi:MAG: MFS transporter [Parasporobacterium sp.]|nr:MFS transporter [Parasporobacterium sp.]
MGSRKIVGFGGRGWLLMIYQAIGYVTYQVFTQYPLNILADLYGGAQLISKIYSTAAIVGIVVQLLLAGVIARSSHVKAIGSTLGIITIGLATGIIFVPAGMAWLVIYAIINVTAVLYGTFSIGLLIGQWFPRRKGTVMGIVTLAFPIANGLLGPFANKVFGTMIQVGPSASDVMPAVLAGDHMPIVMAFLPFYIICIAGWLIGLIFIKDYPEQVGAFRDNDRSFTPEMAQQMMLAEIENKKTSVWTLPRVLTTRDFWFGVIPIACLLTFSIGVMTQTKAIFATQDLSFLGASDNGYTTLMFLIMVFGCVGSLILGFIDTRIGTKKAVLITCVIMIIAGILGATNTPGGLVAGMICLALFMGASSNFGVSLACQYWRREDFGRIYTATSPIGNILSSLGPTIIATALYAHGISVGASGETIPLNASPVFLVVLGAGIIAFVCMMLFSPKHIIKVDNARREKAGKPIDNELEGRK